MFEERSGYVAARWGSTALTSYAAPSPPARLPSGGCAATLPARARRGPGSTDAVLELSSLGGSVGATAHEGIWRSQSDELTMLEQTRKERAVESGAGAAAKAARVALAICVLILTAGIMAFVAFVL